MRYLRERERRSGKERDEVVAVYRVKAIAGLATSGAYVANGYFLGVCIGRKRLQVHMETSYIGTIQTAISLGSHGFLHLFLFSPNRIGNTACEFQY